ncbi:hypothetical protein ACFQ1Q_11285 [Winogradskyella litorisediminis]|uniref:Prenyltransferase n=1 Tax=Winogradskyella litorisediminis TaxID=1156618 RepID=A0ABW3N836_9FLAO
MKVFKSIFSFYINSSIHVALAVFAMSWITLLKYRLPYDENSLYFVFFATITAYNFVKYFGLAKFHHRSLTNELKIIQLFSAFAFVLMCYFLFQLNSKVWWLLCVLAPITFLYAVPFVPKRLLFDNQQNLRQIGGVKVYIIALVWSFVTVLIPLLNFELGIDSEVIISLVQRFVLVIVLMLPFEIRDLQYDNLKLATIPQKIGIKKTKIIGVLLLFVFCFLELLKPETSSNPILSTLILISLTLLSLLFASKKQTKYYSSFWVESIPVFWLLALLLFA